MADTIIYNPRPKRKLTPEQRDGIALRYISGESSISLAREYKVSSVNVLNLIRRRGVKARKSKLTPYQWEEIASRYAAGEKPAKLGEEFKIKAVTVTGISRKKGIPIRGIWDSRGRYKLDHDAFSNQTPESCYWAGFLMADGCISDKKNSVSLSLATKDLSHVEKFKAFVKSEHKITKIPPQKMIRGYVSSGAYRITFVSRKIIDDLAQLGITPRKSHTAKALRGVEFNRDFFRGIVDGDGTITIDVVEKRTYPHIALVGSEPIVNQFRNFVINICPDCSATVRKEKSIYTFSTKGSFAAKIIEFLYKDSTVSLDRKHKTAMEIIKHYCGQY